jgi:predicted porin
MKLNKTVLAVAIAGIAAAPMMASATTTLGGVVQVRISGSDSEEQVPNANGEPFEAGEARVTNGDVRMSFAGSQAMNNGLTGYGSMRLNLDSLSGDDTQSDDQVWVGIKGGFGDFRMGEVPNAGEFGQGIDLHDMGADVNAGIGYTGSFGGATVGVSYSPAPNQDLIAAGAKFSWNGLGLGIGMQDLDENTNIGATASFAYAGASIALQFSQLGDADDDTVVAAKVGYSISGVSLGLTFSQQQDAEDTKIRFDAGYDLGGGLGISTRINSRDNNGEDSSDWRIQLAKSF